MNALTQIGAVENLVDAMKRVPAIEGKLTHRFTPSLYSREFEMPKDSLWVSKTHKTEHQFAVLSGRASVWSEANGVEHISAPFVGITKPGTQRVLLIHEDCLWITFHPTTTTDMDKLESELVEPFFPAVNISATVMNQLKENH